MTEHACFGRWSGYRELLHAQLKPNEVRMCWKDLPAETPPPAGQKKKKGKDPNEPLSDRAMGERVAPSLHAGFCQTALQARKAAIVARGETPVLIGLAELHRRVGVQLQSNDEQLLSCRLSPHPAHRSVLFHMAAWKQQDDNVRLEREDYLTRLEWEEGPGRAYHKYPHRRFEGPPEDRELEPVVSTIRIKRKLECGRWKMTREEILWDDTTPLTDGRLVVPKEEAAVPTPAASASQA
jgi:hypothetical protein